MQLLREYISFLIQENKLDILKKKYPNLDIDDISSHDPSNNKKYIQWMAKQLNSGSKKEDLYPTIKFFHQNQEKFDKKDINTYKNLKELEDFGKNITLASKRQEKQEAKLSGAEKVLDTEQYSLYYISEKRACQIYGSNTKWCVTMANQSYFEEYTQSSVVFYFAIRKQPQNDPMDKVAFAVQRGKNNEVLQVDTFDAEDSQFTINTAFPNGEQLLRFITRDAPKRPKQFLAKLADGDFTKEEFLGYWKVASKETKLSLFDTMFSTMKLTQTIVSILTREEIVNLVANEEDANTRKNLFNRISGYDRTLRIPENLIFKYFKKDPESAIRLSAAQAIYNLDNLIWILDNDNNQDVRKIAFDNILELRHERRFIQTFFREHLDDSNEDIRAASLENISEMNDEEFYRILTRKLKDPSIKVRNAMFDRITQVQDEPIKNDNIKNLFYAVMTKKTLREINNESMLPSEANSRYYLLQRLARDADMKTFKQLANFDDDGTQRALAGKKITMI